MNYTNNTPQTYNDDENYHPDYSLMTFSPLILLMSCNYVKFVCLCLERIINIFKNSKRD